MAQAQEPGATIRVDGKLYQELRAIAEARDCTLRQAMDFWVDRVIKERMDANKDTGGVKRRARKHEGKADKAGKWALGIEGLVEK